MSVGLGEDSLKRPVSPGEAPGFSEDQVLRFRLARQHLAEPAPLESLAFVAGDVCGVQAQVTSSVHLALGARVREVSMDHIERALAVDKSLVKTWAMRGTVHVLPACDLAMYTGALGQSAERHEEWWSNRRNVARETILDMLRASVEALAGGPLTRKELSLRVASRHKDHAEEFINDSWGGIVKQASLQGQVCFGPSRGQEITFVRTDEWLPGHGSMPAEEAENELYRRYLRSYGPATPRDFSYWSGMRALRVGAIVERLAGELVTVDVSGRAALLLDSDIPALENAPPVHRNVRLLPFFDAYLLAHQDKSLFLDQAYYKSVYRKAGWISPVVLVDGRVAGVWSHKRVGKRLEFSVALFRPLSEATRHSVEGEACAIGDLLGMQVASIAYSC